MPHMSQLDIRVRADDQGQGEGRRAAHWYEGKALEIYVNGEPYAGAEMAEIWVPDITPYNGDGLSVSTEPSTISTASGST